MKRVYSLLIAYIAVTASAEIITMDLTTATDIVPHPVTYSTSYGDGYYDCTDVWDSTYNDKGMCQFIYTNEARFMLSHLPSQNSYGGMSWEGFTLSKVSQDTANVFGCVANGGLAGIGTPYVIGYYSSWITESLGYSSNIILFDQEYYPEHVYICQNSNTMEAITNGVFNAQSFTDSDTLSLIISGINNNLEEAKSITYYLAVDGNKNNDWVKVPLHTLGKTAGLSFRMTTTDIGQYGANTPLYFALDGLRVTTELATTLPNINQERVEAQKLIKAGQLYLLYQGKIHSIMGQRVY